MLFAGLKQKASVRQLAPIWCTILAALEGTLVSIQTMFANRHAAILLAPAAKLHQALVEVAANAVSE
jgi:hypothetical protein